MDLLGALLPFAVLFAVMYFMLIRPQKKQQEKKQDMLSNMKPGDSVVTIGGLHGVIDEVSDNGTTVVIDCEGVYLTFEKVAIGRIVEGAAVEERRAEIAQANEIAEAEAEATVEDDFDSADDENTTI